MKCVGPHTLSRPLLQEGMYSMLLETCVLMTKAYAHVDCLKIQGDINCLKTQGDGYGFSTLHSSRKGEIILKKLIAL